MRLNSYKTKIELQRQEAFAVLRSGVLGRECLAAIKIIARELLKGRNLWTEEWVDDPNNLKLIVQLMEVRDTKISEQAVLSIARVVQVYSPKESFIEELKKALTHNSSIAKTWAVQGLFAALGIGSLGYILPLAQDSHPHVRQVVFLCLVWVTAVQDIPSDVLDEARQCCIAHLTDKAALVRSTAASALGNIGTTADLGAIKLALSRYTKAADRQPLNAAIKRIKSHKL